MELPLSRRIGLVLSAICFILVIQSLQSTTPLPTLKAQRTAEAERNALDVLSTSKYKDFDPQSSKWINITGLRSNDGLAWHLLPRVHEKVKDQTRSVLASSWIETGRGKTVKLNSGEFGERYRSVEQVDRADAGITAIPFFKNITGYVQGDWIRHKTQHEGILPSVYGNYSSQSDLGDPFTRNVTGSRGQIHLRIDEPQREIIASQRDLVRAIQAELNIEDASGEGWDVPLKGLYFVESGSAILTTTSDRFYGMLAFPYLIRSENQFQMAQRFFNTSRSTIGLERETLNRFLDSWQSMKDNQDEMFPMPQCDYVVYLQQHLVWPFETDGPLSTTEYAKQSSLTSRMSYLDSLEAELRQPTGMPLKFVPSLKFSATIFSPDCGFILESDGFARELGQGTSKSVLHLKGHKIEVILSRIRIHTILYGVIVLAQIYFLIRQVNESSTPSTESKVSYYTIALMVMADCSILTTSLLFGAVLQGVYLPVVTVSFFLFLCVPLFGLRFLVDVWTSQEPERRERERERAAAMEERERGNRQTRQVPVTYPTQTVTITPAGVDLLPLPVTARRAPEQVILPPDQDIDAMLAEDELLHGPALGTGTISPQNRINLGTRVLFLSFLLTILSYIVSLWPATVRSIYTNFIVFCYLSFWTPQIYRNILRNCRKALRWEFVVGQSVSRLLPVAYFYVYGDNIFSVATSPYAFAVFAAWQWAQILLLFSQDILGPRFFLPAGILPPAYDYHQVLREGDEENGGGFMPIGFTQDGMSPTGESKEKGTWQSDCIICMNPLEAQYIPLGVDSGTGAAAAMSNMFARREYMITPCRHIFHSQCLDGWMKYKLQCPICRESLPPL